MNKVSNSSYWVLNSLRVWSRTRKYSIDVADLNQCWTLLFLKSARHLMVVCVFCIKRMLSYVLVFHTFFYTLTAIIHMCVPEYIIGPGVSILHILPLVYCILALMSLYYIYCHWYIVYWLLPSAPYIPIYSQLAGRTCSWHLCKVFL